MKRKLLKGLVTVFFSTIAMNASATSITFVETGSGSGSLNGVSFSNSDFTIKATGDTTNRYFNGFNAYIIVDNSATIDIKGVGTYNFITKTSFAVNHSYDEVVFGNNAANLALLIGPTSSSFSTWDMLSSIGPVSGSGSFMQWTNSPVQTSGGILAFNVESAPVTFTAGVGAAPVPEPSTIVLLGAGLAGIGIIGCRKHRKS